MVETTSEENEDRVQIKYLRIKNPDFSLIKSETFP